MSPTIPSITHFASPELVADIVYGGRDPADDPRWPESGAPTRADYARWCSQWCGMTCLAMVLAHRDGRSPTLHDLLAAGLPYGTYVPQPDGTIRGLIYDPFVAYIRAEHGLDGEVHREIRRPDRPAPGRGGHLVLVTVHDPTTDTLTFHNPSGHTPTTRQATLPTPTFTTFWSHRAITLHHPGRGGLNRAVVQVD